MLVGIVERRLGASAVGDELVKADGGIDESAAWQSQLLIVAGYCQERREVGRGIVDVADSVALVERVVDPISVRLESVAIERCRPRACVGCGRHRRQALVEGADAAFGADRDRRSADAGLGDDVDDAADRVVAIEHGAAVASGNLDSLDRIARKGRKIDTGHIDVVESPAVDEHEAVGGGERTESAKIDGGPHAVHATEQRRQLDAGRLRNDFLDRLGRRVRNILGSDD